MSNAMTDDLQDATSRFEAALLRLEIALASSVSKVADLARRTGFEDGKAEGVAQSTEFNDNSSDVAPLLREELEASKAREASLHDAVTSARLALNEAMDDIRKALGPV
jgi:hypothetical protein